MGSNFRKFLLLWSGELVSSIGGGLTSFGLGVYIFQQTGSAASMALVTLLGFLPTLLLSVPAVKKTAEETGELVAGARNFLNSYQADTLKLYRGRFVINVLSVIGGVMALVEIMAAYELMKNRFLLIAPPLICLLCTAGAEAINVQLGLGQMYVAIGTALFALVQLLTVLPRKKRPLYNARH